MPALGRWLDAHFIPSLGEHVQAVSKSTAYGGPRRGVWSQPDYVVASVRRYAYSTLREVDLFGFELKRAGAASVVGVHEALAHTRWVHFSFLVLHLPDRTGFDAEAMSGECARHGIGLVVFADPNVHDTWSIEIDPQRRAADPLNVDRFIEERFDEDRKLQLRQWLHSS